MSCQPNDYYCLPQNLEQDFLSFYATNTGLSGPLKKPRIMKSTLAFQDVLQTGSLPYADPKYAQMSGARVFHDEKFNQFNAHRLPSDLFTRTVVIKENCSCSKRKFAKT